MVVACADAVPDSIIITGDSGDLQALADERKRSIVVDLNRVPRVGRRTTTHL
jgi:hypothetical protein